MRYRSAAVLVGLVTFTLAGCTSSPNTVAQSPAPASPAPASPPAVAQNPSPTPTPSPSQSLSPTPVGNLIPSTNPAVELARTRAGRQDPFSIVQLPLKVTLPASATPVPVRPKPVKPLPPQPDLARAVQVTGVVDIDGSLQAIVKAPEERTSRTVVAGDTLADGQVQVTRIFLSGDTPVVVLTQFGIQVFKTVSGPTA